MESCPGRNIALNGYPEWDSHPLNSILDAGIAISLNADDPPFFDTPTGMEYKNAVEHFGMSVSQLRDISRMAVEASFADVATKQQLLAKIGE